MRQVAVVEKEKNNNVVVDKNRSRRRNLRKIKKVTYRQVDENLDAFLADKSLHQYHWQDADKTAPDLFLCNHCKTAFYKQEELDQHQAKVGLRKKRNWNTKYVTSLKMNDS